MRLHKTQWSCAERSRIRRASVAASPQDAALVWSPRLAARLLDAAEVHACRPWLDAELRALSPAVLVCLGATAAKALLGASFEVSSQERGRFVDRDLAPAVLATVHPSSILRAEDEARDAAMASFVDDLRVAASALPAR